MYCFVHKRTGVLFSFYFLFLGIGIGDATKEKCLQLAMRQFVKQNWKNCDHLIIDEISMIDSYFFEVWSVSY